MTTSTPARRSLVQHIFSFPGTLAAALLATTFLLATNSQAGGQELNDPDIWWHLANARYLITTHHFIQQDIFSFTVSGKPWINFEWLSELPYYFAYQAFGESGLYFTMLLLCSAIILGVFLLAYERSRDAKAAALASFLAVFMASVSLAPRMILFGWLLLVIELAIIRAFSHARDYTWATPILFALWINAHGTWLIGFVLWLVWAASGFISGTWGSVEATRWTYTQQRRLLFVTAASFAALFINPYGWRLVAYPFDLAFKQSDNIKYIAEWATLDFHGPRGKLVLFVVFSVAIANLVKRRTWPLAELLFAVIAVYAAFTYSRFLFLGGILLTPLIAVELRGLLGGYDPKDDPVGRNLVSISLIAAFVLWLMPGKAKLHKSLTYAFPEKALEQLRSLPKDAHIFNHYEWGGYLIWQLPEQPVFIDPRADIFVHEGVFQDYIQAATPFHSLELFDKYKVNYVLIPPDTSLGYFLDHTQGWKQEYHAPNAVLYRRAIAAN